MMLTHKTALLFVHAKKHPDARFYAGPHKRLDTSIFQNSTIDDVITHYVFDWHIKPNAEDKK